MSPPQNEEAERKRLEAEAEVDAARRAKVEAELALRQAKPKLLFNRAFHAISLDKAKEKLEAAEQKVEEVERRGERRARSRLSHPPGRATAGVRSVPPFRVHG
eukprot:3972182-Prymnesium_polylepis.1